MGGWPLFYSSLVIGAWSLVIFSYQRPEKIERLPRRLRRHMAVPAQLDVQGPAISGPGQRIDDRRELHFPVAKHQMLVNSGPHVFNVYVNNSRPPPHDVVG